MPIFYFFFVLLLLLSLSPVNFFSFPLKSNSWILLQWTEITFDRSHGIYSIPITHTHKKNIEISRLFNHTITFHQFILSYSLLIALQHQVNDYLLIYSFSLCPIVPTNSYFVASIWFESNSSTMWPTTSLLPFTTTSSSSTIFLARSMRQT